MSTTICKNNTFSCFFSTIYNYFRFKVLWACIQRIIYFWSHPIICCYYLLLVAIIYFYFDFCSILLLFCSFVVFFKHAI